MYFYVYTERSVAWSALKLYISIQHTNEYIKLDCFKNWQKKGPNDKRFKIEIQWQYWVKNIKVKSHLNFASLQIQVLFTAANAFEVDPFLVWTGVRFENQYGKKWVNPSRGDI